MSTLYVAASDANRESKARAQYVCDGINDSAILNNALREVAITGGTLGLSEGTFHLTEPLTYPQGCVCIIGAGGLSYKDEFMATRLQFNLAAPSDSCVVFYPDSAGQSLERLAVIGDGITTKQGVVLGFEASLNTIRDVYICDMILSGVRGDAGNSQNYLERVITRDCLVGFWMFGVRNTFNACQAMRSQAAGAIVGSYGFRIHESSSAYFSCTAEMCEYGFLVGSWADSSMLVSCAVESCDVALIVTGVDPVPDMVSVYGFCALYSQHSTAPAVIASNSHRLILRDLRIESAMSGLSMRIEANAHYVQVAGGSYTDDIVANSIDHRMINVLCKDEWINHLG